MQRMPRCRRGYIHVVNNDFTEWQMYAIGGSASPTINSQGNRYMAPNDPNAKEVTIYLILHIFKQTICFIILYLTYIRLKRDGDYKLCGEMYDLFDFVCVQPIMHYPSLFHVGTVFTWKLRLRL